MLASLQSLFPRYDKRMVQLDMGRSLLCPFVPGEDAGERHRRRYDLAVANLPVVAAWCEHRGVQFTTTGSNHREAPGPHWKWDFRVPGKFAQWRPFAGKFNASVDLSQGVTHGIKVYGTDQLLTVLDWWLLQ